MSQKPAVVATSDTFETWRVAFNTLLDIAPEVVESASAAPLPSDDDYEVGTFWIQLDTNEAWILVHTTGFSDAIWLALGSTPGAILDTGAVPLIANWDAGAFTILAQRFEATQTDTGTSPFIVTSKTTVTNLSSEYVGGIAGPDLLKKDGSVALTGNWAVGGLDITGIGGFTSDMITANAVAVKRMIIGDQLMQVGHTQAGSLYSITRTQNDAVLVISGGGTQTNGFNIKLYGVGVDGGGGQANDCEFKAQGAIKLAWDHSQTRWDFKSQEIFNPGLVDGRNVSTDGTKLDSIDTDANDYTHPNHTGDVTSVFDGDTTIVAGAVDNTKLADMDEYLIKGKPGAGTGDPEDIDILALNTESAPDPATDFLLGKGPGGLRKFAAGSWDPAAPVLQRNPFKAHNNYGGAAATTINIDCEQYQSASINCTGGTVVIDLDFPPFSSPPERGLDQIALSGKIFVQNSGAAAINITDDSTTNPFSGGGGAKGVPPSNGEYGILVWEFWDDGVGSNRFAWTEWINE